MYILLHCIFNAPGVPIIHLHLIPVNRPVRFLALLFFSLLFAASARGQHAFQAILPGLTPALKRPALQTPDGGFVLLAEGGQTALTFPDGTTSPYPSRTVILKTDPNGHVVWSRSFAEPSGPRVYPVTMRATPDGGFLVLANAIEEETQQQSILLYRLDAHGFPLWSRTFTGNAQEVAWGGDIILFDDGSAVIAGAVLTIDSIVRRVDPQTTKVIHTRMSWESLLFGIDSEGEVLWSRMIDTLPERAAYERIRASFASAIVRRGGNRATIAISLNHFLWHTSSLMITLNTKGEVTDEPVWMRTWPTPLSGLKATSDDYGNRLDINDMALLPDGGLAVSGAMRNHEYYTLTGFLCMFDGTTAPTIRHTYPNALHTGPFTFSLHPVGNRRFLAAGRTPLVNRYDGVNGYDDDLDEPTIGLIDADGSLLGTRTMTTPMNEVLPIPDDAFGPAGSYLDQPHFAVTKETDLISVGTIRTKEDRSRRTLFLARFNPDFAGCSQETEGAAEFRITEPQQTDYEWYGRSGFPNPDDYPIQARPFHYSCTNLWRIERMKDSAGWAKEREEREDIVASWSPDFEYYVETLPYCHEISLADVRNPPTNGQDMPIIDYMKIRLADAAVRSTRRPLPEVEELKITPRFLCGDAALDADGLPAGTYPVEAQPDEKQRPAKLEVQ